MASAVSASSKRTGICGAAEVTWHLPAWDSWDSSPTPPERIRPRASAHHRRRRRSEEHTSELQSLMRNSYAVFCLKKKTHHKQTITSHNTNTENYTHTHYSIVNKKHKLTTTP